MGRLLLTSAILLVLAAWAGARRVADRARAQQGTTSDAAAAQAAARADPVVARGHALGLCASELERLLVERYIAYDSGRELLRLEVCARLIDRLGRERGIDVDEREVSQLWSDLDRQSRASGASEGIAGAIRAQGFTEPEFREYLRIQIVQQRLTRAALGLAERAEVSGDAQQIWLEQELNARGYTIRPPPWSDGVLAVCGEVTLTCAELGRAFRKHLPRKDVRETAWHALLVRGIEARMPDLAAEAREAAIDQEMQRRKLEHEKRVEAQGVSYEQLLSARGSSVEIFRRDPSVRIAALSRLWVDRTLGPTGVRKAYEDDRSYYEGLHGRAAATHMLFLDAAKTVNDLNPRSFEMAERELLRLTESVRTNGQFAALCALHCEEPSVREARGELGWVTRDDPRWPAPLRGAIFAFLETGGVVPPGGTRLGPVRLESGVALLWLSAVRETPAWEEMRENVHADQRRRFLEDVLREREVELVPAP
jgi:hypothetical protein